MIRPRHMPPDAYFDDPAAHLDPPESTVHDLAFALASGGFTLVGEWVTRGRGGAKQRALRFDLVLLCMCPQFLPCKRPCAAWVARQHGVSRQRASLLQQEFAREIGPHIQFSGQRFLNRAHAFQGDGTGGGGGKGGRSPARSHSPTPPAAVPQARRR